MQSLLQAVGVGAKNSLPAAAGINWVLKDGLGRLGRLSVSTRFGTSFDSNLKVLPCLAITLWYLANTGQASVSYWLLDYRAARASNQYLHV